MLTEKQLFCLLPTLSKLLLLLVVSCTLLEPTASAVRDNYLQKAKNSLLPESRQNNNDYFNAHTVSLVNLPDNRGNKIRRSTDDERIQRRIKEIFHWDSSEKDKLVLFNKTMLTPNFTFINRAKPDKSYQNNSPHQQPQFKVQRSPDGKLNLVVNDVIVYLQKPINAQTPALLPNRDFVYPTDTPKPTAFTNPDGVTTRINLPGPPVCADTTGKTFCTKVVNYPKVDYLEGLLKGELEKFVPFFGEDLPAPLNVSQRINGQPMEESLCDSISRIVYPEAGKTRDNVDMYIVNSPTYKQGVRVEECQNEEKECKYADSFPNGYKTKCKQQFIYRQLVALTRDGVAVKREFQIPSCCMCMVINLKG